MSWAEGVCRANGIEIHYARTGAGKPPVVLLHGLMGSGACWVELARALEGDFDVVMPDGRGHGRSSAPGSGYDYATLAGDVEGLVTGLGLERPVLLGHSMGGLVAAVTASRGVVALGGLVLVDPTFLSPERQREVFASDVAEQHRRALGRSRAELVADARARHPTRAQATVEAQAEARLATRTEALAVLAPPNPPFREVMARVACETLLVIAEHGVVTRKVAGEIAAGNPRVRVEEVAGAGHGVPFERPEEVARVVMGFLGAVGARARGARGELMGS